MAKRIRIIDSHTGGEPTRVVLDGITTEELEHWRRGIIVEPRGNGFTVGALLIEPQNKTCCTGVIFFNNIGRLGMCGHGLIGVITTLQYLGRITPGIHSVETPVGIVTATLHEDGRVSVRNVPSYRLAKDITAGRFTGDVAWGGNWFFLISDHGMKLKSANISALTTASMEALHAIREGGYTQVDHIEFFSEPEDPQYQSRNFVLCPGGEYDRSPCGTGTSAKLACLAANGLLAPGEVWRQESIIGSVFEASYENADAGIIPTITGRAFITAEATLHFDPADPFMRGVP